jgi:hypothetical protein
MIALQPISWKRMAQGIEERAAAAPGKGAAVDFFLDDPEG